jgi:hypothetical protein
LQENISDREGGYRRFYKGKVFSDHSLPQRRGSNLISPQNNFSHQSGINSLEINNFAAYCGEPNPKSLINWQNFRRLRVGKSSGN